MAKSLISPPEFRSASNELKMSPGILSGDFVFLTGVTGSDTQGRMPEEPEAQFRKVFEKIELVLREAGLTMQSIAEMTSYHVGLREHFDLFDSIRLEYLDAPYPAWTAIEAGGLRREGAVVEIRAIANIAAAD